MNEITNAVTEARPAALVVRHSSLLNLIGGNGYVGVFLWSALLCILAIGLFAAFRRRYSGLYWATAHVHFLTFVHAWVFGSAFVPCLCLTPWSHDPSHHLMGASTCFLIESVSILLVGLVVNLRAVRRPRLAWLPLISCILLTLDCIAIWTMRIGIFKLTRV